MLATSTRARLRALVWSLGFLGAGLFGITLLVNAAARLIISRQIRG